MRIYLPSPLPPDGVEPTIWREWLLVKFHRSFSDDGGGAAKSSCRNRSRCTRTATRSCCTRRVGYRSRNQTANRIPIQSRLKSPVASTRKTDSCDSSYFPASNTAGSNNIRLSPVTNNKLSRWEQRSLASCNPRSSSLRRNGSGPQTRHRLATNTPSPHTVRQKECDVSWDSPSRNSR